RKPQRHKHCPASIVFPTGTTAEIPITVVPGREENAIVYTFVHSGTYHIHGLRRRIWARDRPPVWHQLRLGSKTLGPDRLFASTTPTGTRPGAWVLAGTTGIVGGLLADDQCRPRKQRHTAARCL